MKYVEFKARIQNTLQGNPNGLTWKDLKNTLNFPYKIPCQTWICQLEDEIHLVRSKGKGRAFIWKIDK